MRQIPWLFLPLLAAVGIPTGGAGAESERNWHFESIAAATRDGGHATYEIGGVIVADGERERVHFPISRLRWPMPRWTARLGAEARHRSGWLLHGAIALAPSADAAAMEDSDWEDDLYTDRVTTYSESNTTARGFEMEFGARRVVYSHSGERDLLELLMGGGVWFRRNDWTARDALQWEPHDPFGTILFVEGEVVRYRLTAWLPYAEVSARWRRGRWEARARAALAPYVRATDRDDHLLRGIESRATTDGVGGRAELAARRDIGRAWFVQAGLHYAAFVTDGRSRNRVYGGDDPDAPIGARWTIDQEIESEQFGASLGIGAQF